MSKKIYLFLAAATVVGMVSLFVSCGSSSSRPSDVLYVLSQGENNVGYFAINLDNGGLSLVNKTTPTDTNPSSIILDPTSKAAYVLNTGVNDAGLNTITSYPVNSDGSLGTMTSTPIPVHNAVAMARDTAGTFLVVASQGAIPPPPTGVCPQVDPNADCPALTVFSIQPGSSTVTQMGDPFQLDRVPTSVATSIAGGAINGTLIQVTANFDLTENNVSNTISEFVVQADGSIAGPLPVADQILTQSNPSSVLSVTTTPTGGTGGTFVYVTNVTTFNIDVFQVCTVVNGGTCTSQADVNNAKLNPVGSPVTVGLDPVGMVTDPTNNFLYVVNKGASTISAFRINPSTGALSNLSPATVSTGSQPVALAMHSTGKFLYVSNNASSNVSGFNVDTTSGALSTPTTVTSTAQPAGMATR